MGEYLQKVDGWCCENVNKVLSIDYPGDRRKATKNNHGISSVKVFCQSTFVHYMRAEIVTALYAIGLEGKTMEFIQSGERSVKMFSNAKVLLKRKYGR